MNDTKATDTSISTNLTDIAEIRAGLDLFFRDGDGVEMRVLRKKDVPYSTNTSGFFKRLDKLARAIAQMNSRMVTVFVTMNPLQPKSDWILYNNIAYVGAKPPRQELEKAGHPLEPRMKATTDRETDTSSDTCLRRGPACDAVFVFRARSILSLPRG